MSQTTAVDPAFDPVLTCPELYRVVFENDRVRVLEYRDQPGDRTTLHNHPDSLMYVLGSFRRAVSDGEREVEVALEPGQVRWVSAQQHQGRNIGDTPSHAIFVELKEPAPGAGASSSTGSELGPGPAAPGVH